MAWETGSASGHIDLVDKLVTFLSTDAGLVSASQNWEVLQAVQALPFTTPAPNGRIAFSSRAPSPVVLDPWPSGIANEDVRLHITGAIEASLTGTYLFSFMHEDWIEVRVDGTLVVAHYAAAHAGTFPTSGLSTGSIALSAGTYDLDIRLIASRGAQASVSHRGVTAAWQKPGDGSVSIIPAASLSGLSIAWGYNPSGSLNNITGTVEDFAAVMADVECYLRGPGASDSDDIFVAMRTVSSATSDTFNILVHGATGHVPGARMPVQPGSSVTGPAMLLWEDAITYWFVAHGRRFIVIAKVSTVYESMYAGLGLPYGLPTEYPYMLVIGASSSIWNLRFSNNSTAHTSFWNPGRTTTGASDSCLTVRSTSGQWLPFTNYHTEGGYVYPTNAVTMFEERPAPDGSYAITPLVLYTPGTDVLGELDGAYHVTGFGNASENIITVSGDDYLVVQSANRTTSTVYGAIKLS
jgi:hypothetical protein